MRVVAVIIICFCLPVFYFSQEHPNACLDELFSQKLKPEKKYAKRTELDEAADITRHVIDSLNYTIIRDWNGNFRLIREWIYNDDNGVCFMKEFYENGKLVSKGYMTNLNTTQIGIWNYYTEKGDRDSTFNYDTQNGIPFCEFLKVVQSNGMYDRTTVYEIDTGHKNWTAIRTFKDNKGIETMITFYMNLETKKTSMKHETPQR